MTLKKKTCKPVEGGGGERILKIASAPSCARSVGGGVGSVRFLLLVFDTDSNGPIRIQEGEAKNDSDQESLLSSNTMTLSGGNT